MQTALRLTARVLPGKRVEFASPDLPDGGEVELIVMLPEPTILPTTDASAPKGVLDFIQSLPPGPRSAATWDEVERNYRTERDSWD